MKVLKPLIFACFASAAMSVAAVTPQEISDKAMEGYRLFTRDSLPDDRPRGYSMMLEAAWEGDAKAANNIGWLKERGDFTEKDLPGALQWYERASDQGLPAAALNYAGMIFRHPESLEGRQADIRRVAQATMTAGKAMAMGRGLPYDYRQGEDLMMRAALLGDEEAALTIAQQLEMYPDSFSYLPLAKIAEECDALLPSDRKNLQGDTSAEALGQRMLTPEFWYARVAEDGAL